MACHNKLLYEFYKRNGICVRCGQVKAVQNRVKCTECLGKDADSQRRRREKLANNEQAQ